MPKKHKMKINLTINLLDLDRPCKYSLSSRVTPCECNHTNPSFDFIKIRKLMEKLAELIDAINVATERWLELAEKV